MISCSNVTNADNSFCCDHTNGCCDSGAGRFNVLPKEAEVWATWNVEASSYRVVGTVYTGNPTSTSSAPTRSSTSTGTTTATSATPTGTAPNDSDKSSGLSNGAKIGIGVGVGVGVVLLAAIAFLAWKLRQRKGYGAAPAQAPMQELDGRAHTPAELDARGKKNQDLRPPAELAG